jgi:hypothetical protein
MAGKFDRWASSTRIGPALPTPSPAPIGHTIIIPGRVPPDLVQVDLPEPRPHNPPAPATAARLIAVHRPQVQVHPSQVPPRRVPIASPTCLLVKPHEGDKYAALLGELEELAPDLSEGVDAMRLAGVPSGAEMKDWKPTTRYWNGVTDLTAGGRLEQHVGQRYQDSVGSVRESTASVKRGQNFLDEPA